MIPPDLAFALLINRTSDYYANNPPQYMTYTELTHVTATSVGRSQDINRSVAVRVADNFAVMKDLPNGAERTGQAYPVTSYFDPFSAFGYSWFANLKRIDIKVELGRPWVFSTPDPDPSVNVVVPYFSYWSVHYAQDSTDAALHFLIDATPGYKYGIYPSEVVEDPQSHLPSHIEMRSYKTDEMMAFDYKVIDGHWVLTHFTWSGTEHALVYTSKVIFDANYNDIAFPSAPPDPRLAGTPMPSPTPTP